MNWGQVCLPKANGGLGLRKAASENRALPAKTGWRMMQRKNYLWVQVLNRKYLIDYDTLGASHLKFINPSSTWRAILHGTRCSKRGSNGEFLKR